MAVKSVTFKIGADTSDFVKGLKQADKAIRSTESQSKELQNGLKLEFDESRFVASQKLAQQALTQTEEKAKAIREQLKYLEQTGGIDTDGYNKLQTELVKTENKAVLLKNQLKEIDKIKFDATTKDLYKNIEKTQTALDKSVNNAKTLSTKLNDTSLYGNKLKSVQEQVAIELKTASTNARELKKQINELEKAGAPTEEINALKQKLEDAKYEATQLEEELEKSTKLNYERVSSQLKNVSSNLTKAGNAAKGLSIAAAAALAGIVKLGVDAVATGDEIQTTADQYNLSAEAIQKWNYVALQTDVSTEQLYKGITKVRDAVGTALVGDTNTATEALTAMGLSAENLGNSDEAFYKVVTALSEVEDTTLRAYYANEIFGERVATELIPLLNQGGDALAELSNEFESVGYLSNEQVRSLSNFDNELNTMKTQLSLAKTELGIAFLPILEKLADFLTNKVIPAIEKLTNWFSNLPSGVQDSIIVILGLLAVLAPVLLIGGKLIGIVATLIKSIPILKGVLTALGTATGSMLLSVAAFAAALVLIFNVIENWGSMNSIQKVISILGILTVVAFGAAIALGAFHSAWSLGLAVAGIVAGIVAVTAAVNSAKNSISSDIPDIETPSLSGSSSSQVATNSTTPQYNIDTNYGVGKTGTSNIDNSQNTYNIEIQSNEYMNADQLVEAVSKKLVLKKQARS